MDIHTMPDRPENTATEEAEQLTPTFLTDAKSNPLRTLYLEYINDLPEYPRTDMDGYTYVVNVEGRTQKEAESLVDDIQYSKASFHGQKRNVKCSFLNCMVSKRTWKCSGALVCEYLKPYLKTLYHSYIDEGTWQQIREQRENAERIETDERKRNARSLYRTRQDFFKRTKPCIDFKSTCKLEFRRSFHPDINGLYTPYLACANNAHGFLEKHWTSGLQGRTMVDFDFLESLFNSPEPLSAEGCDVIEPRSSRRKICDNDHIQGPGEMKHQPCKVIFTALVPIDIKSVPYLLFVSSGHHQHPPPPPHKPPQMILKGIEDIIVRLRNPSITLAQFLRSPQLEAFCRQYHAQTPADIHASFSNIDRISAIIQKQRLLLYPAGQEYNGVTYLYNTDDFIKSYIQARYFDDGKWMIVCAFPEQISLLRKLSSFEVDMSYKRIRGKELNEVVFATYLEAHAKVVTLLRVFLNKESTEAYYLLFKRVFKQIEVMIGEPLKFFHLHGSGIKAIVVDMDSKQYTGLAQYLQELDPYPQPRPIEWHLQSILIFCRVHFFRNISEAIGSKEKGTMAWGRMAGLVDCQSEQDYDNLVDLLCLEENPKVRQWAEQKKSKVIKAGLNKACSLIPEAIWESIRNNTNSAEQSHHKANAAGIRLSLTEAIRGGAKIDRQDIYQYINRTVFGVHHSYRTASTETNFARNLARDESRKRNRSETRPSSEKSSTTGAERIVPKFTAQATAFEQRKQELELKRLEEDIKRQQLENEERELALMERRAKLQQQLERID